MTRRKNIFLNMKLDKISTGIFSFLMYMVNNVLVNTDTTLHQKSLLLSLVFIAKNLLLVLVHQFTAGVVDCEIGRSEAKFFVWGNTGDERRTCSEASIWVSIEIEI